MVAYSIKKISSTLRLNTLEMAYANFNEGLYFPFSRNTMVSRRTPTFCARSTWVRLSLARNSLILVFIQKTGLGKIQLS